MGSLRPKPAAAGPADHPIAADHHAFERAVLAAALDPVITIDARGIVRSASDSVMRVFGWARDELVGKNIQVLMPEPHRSRHDRYLSEYLRTGVTNIMGRPRELQGIRRDGTVFPIELCVSRADIPGASGPLFVGIIRDISLQKRAEQELSRHRDELDRLVRERTAQLERSREQLHMADRMASIGTLAAGLGHDMNNVLLPVRAHLNALRADAKGLSAAAREHVESIRKSVAYLQQLADGLHFLALDPTRSEASEGATDLREWWSQVGPLLSKAVPKHVRVTASWPEGLPRIGVPAHALTQAMLNLVVNAGEAIPARRKRRQGHVRLSAGKEGNGDRVRISVTDNGAGMTEDVRRRAFDMFFTTKPRGLGTGLGLALVRQVAEQAGGEVIIDSDVDRGTTVTMAVPRSDAADRTIAAVISIRDGRAASLIRQVLESGGARVVVAEDPGDADIWVTEAAAGLLPRAESWVGGHQRRRVVLFGRGPDSAAAWAALDPVTIEDGSDFEAVRKALGRAIGGS